MFTSDFFEYDGIRSNDYDIRLVNLSNGLIESSFGTSRNLNLERVPGNPIPYMFNIEEEPLQLELTFIKNTPWTIKDRTDVARWLFKKDYKTLISSKNSGIIYHAIAVGDPKKFMNGLHDGYCTATFQCDAPWAWTMPEISTFDLNSITTPTTIDIVNVSNIDDYNYPEIEFQICGDATSFSMKSLSDGGREFKFENLNTTEKVYVNNKYKRIISDSGLYRYNNFNKVWLRTSYGHNYFQISTKSMIQIKTEYPVML